MTGVMGAGFFVPSKAQGDQTSASRNPKHRHASEQPPVRPSVPGPHTSADCVLALYLERQAIWLSWQRNRYGDDYDLSDGQFWNRFGQVPVCSCPGRVKQREEFRLAPTQRGGFQMSFGPVSVWTWRTLRTRLRRMLMKQTGLRQLQFFDLEELAPRAAPSAARVIARLRNFEAPRR